MNNNDKDVKIGIGFLFFIAICIMIAGVFSDTNQYNKEPKKILKIVEPVQIRSEPIAYDDSADGDSNSFGKVEEAGFTVEITKFYEATVIDKANGAFYGFSVKEIRKTPEGRDYFPKGIKEDPDGIVWINAKYIEIY